MSKLVLKSILCMNQNSVAKLSHGFSSFVTLYKYLMSKKVYHHSFVASNIVAMVTYIVQMTNVICLSIVINGNNLGVFRGVKCIMNSINTTLSTVLCCTDSVLYQGILVCSTLVCDR